MCGLAGFLGREGWNTGDEMLEVAREMADTLQHRGPDHADQWGDPSHGIAMGFRRLSIIDRSPTGHQPMTSPSGRYVIAYNGEVYNFERIRDDLQSAGWRKQFRGHSDTEVLLSAIERWGLDDALERCIGMFAFALWDREARRLHLVRDRLGIKPLFYGWSGQTFLFASELKALRAHPGFSASIDRQALSAYMHRSYVPGPQSIYRDIYKLTPGSILTVPVEEGSPRTERYWSPRSLAESADEARYSGSESRAVDELDRQLRDAVSLRTIADVPLGVFLSGGIDSSTVAALMQEVTSGPVKTFTVGFSDQAYNEAPHARAVAEHLGTDHTDIRVNPEEAMEIIPSLPSMFDEPFADSSQINAHLVSKLARRHVTVCLSGDGGDELFGGYPRYNLLTRGMGPKLRSLPGAIRRRLSELVESFTSEEWDRLLEKVQPFLPRRLRQRHPGTKLHKLAQTLRVESPEDIYEEVVSTWPPHENVVLGAARGYAGRRLIKNLEISDFAERMMVADILTYLVDDILVKMDRASMAVSLEAREPLLDHRVVEFALQLPVGLKIREGQGKWLLRQVLFRYVPESLMSRPKAGFGVPLGKWLRGPLREWADSLLDEQRLSSEGYFDARLIRRKWKEHLDGQPHAHALWNVLMFQSWLEEQR